MTKTMRQWLQERVDNGQELGSNPHHTEPAKAAIATLTRSLSMELDKPVEEVTVEDLYAPFGCVGHVARTDMLALVWLEYVGDKENAPEWVRTRHPA